MLGKIRPMVSPIARVFAKPFILLKINPNIVSIIGLFFALVGAFFVYSQNWVFALIFFILAPGMDLLDGQVARALNKVSNFGNYFETMIDRLVDFISIGSFVFFFPLLSILTLGFVLISSYAKPRVALIIITDNHDWPAIGEHSDKLAILILGLLFASIIPFFFPAITAFLIIELMLYCILFVSIVGTFQRILYAKKLIEKAEKENTLLPYIKSKKER